jgi:predicted MFS family arabinose efflux permease
VLRLSFAARAVLLVAAFLAGPVALVVVLGVGARMLGQLDNPSFDALIPSQAVDDLQQVIALRRFIQSVSIIVGPAIGAVLVWWLGPRPTMVAAAALFVVAVAVHATMHGLDRDLATRRAQHHDSTWLELARGMAIVATTPFVRRLIVWWMISLVTVAMAMAAAAVWFEDTLGEAEYWYGLSVAAYGTGAALGTLLFGGRSFRLSLPALLLIASPTYAVTCALGVVAAVPWLMGAGWLLWGLAMGPEIVRSDPEFVARIDPASLGRAYAGAGVATTLGMAMGYALAGPLLDAFGPRTTTYLAAALILVTGTMWVGPLLRGEARPAPSAGVRDVPVDAPAATLPAE